MAMNTWLQMVSEDEIAALKRDPTSINKLNKPKTESVSTYFGCTVNYFVVGEAYPTGTAEQPLHGLLGGFESVACTTLENGAFQLVPPAMAEPIADALAAIDLDDIKDKVNAADPDDLADADVDDFEVLADGDEEDAGETLIGDIQSLLAFYRKAAKAKRGVVIYTS